MALIATCICSWPNTTAPSITSSDRLFASDSTISTASAVPATTRSSFEVLRSVAVGIQQVLPVTVADARGADRALERDARQRERGGSAEHRGDVRVDVRIERHDRGDHLHFVEEALGEQRADRAVDQARGERLLLRRPAFALEEAAGDAAGRVGLLDVVDRQREEVLVRVGVLAADGGDEDHGVAHGDEDRAVGLAREAAGFDGDSVRTVGK